MFKINMPHSSLLVDTAFNTTTQAVDCSITSTTGQTANIVYPLTAEGKLCPIVFNNSICGYICVLAKSSADEIKSLQAKSTIFVTEDGSYVTDTSDIEVIYPVPDTIRFINPKDMVHSIIPPSKLNNENGLIHLTPGTRTFQTPINVTIWSVTVHRNNQTYPGLYTHVTDGLDCLDYTDMLDGMVVEVGFTKDESPVVQYEYISINV